MCLGDGRSDRSRDIMIVEYVFPLIGDAINWETLSGDPSDRLRPGGIYELAKANVWSISWNVLNLDTEAGEVVIALDASPSQHGAIRAWLATRTLADICSDIGVLHRKRPIGATPPRAGFEDFVPGSTRPGAVPANRRPKR